MTCRETDRRTTLQRVEGAHDNRDWVVALAAGDSGFEPIDDFPSPQTLVGAALASWKVAA